jgi:hypothetical protein
VVTNAKRHSGRLGSALQRDFEQAQKRLKQGKGASNSRARTSTTRRAKSTTSARRRPATRSRRGTTRATSRSSSR